MASGTIKALAESVTSLAPARSNITISGYTCTIFANAFCLVQFEFSSTAAIDPYTSIVTGFPQPTETANFVGLPAPTPNSAIQMFIDRKTAGTPGHMKARGQIAANTVVRLGFVYAL